MLRPTLIYREGLNEGQIPISKYPLRLLVHLALQNEYKYAYTGLLWQHRRSTDPVGRAAFVVEEIPQFLGSKQGRAVVARRSILPSGVRARKVLPT
jgi:hypothetical protein